MHGRCLHRHHARSGQTPIHQCLTNRDAHHEGPSVLLAARNRPSHGTPSRTTGASRRPALHVHVTKNETRTRDRHSFRLDQARVVLERLRGGARRRGARDGANTGSCHRAPEIRDLRRRLSRPRDRRGGSEGAHIHAGRRLGDHRQHVAARGQTAAVSALGARAVRPYSRQPLSRWVHSVNQVAGDEATRGPRHPARATR